MDAESTASSDRTLVATLTELQELRHKLLRLHKTLLDLERAKYERVFGRVTSGKLLQLVLNNAQFAWLRVLSTLVVEIDETLDQDEPATLDELQNFFPQTRSLLTSSVNAEYQQKYQAALQDEPGVVMIHSEIMNLLGREA